MHQKSYQKLLLEIVHCDSSKNCKALKDQSEIGKGYGASIDKTINGVLIRNIATNILNCLGHPECCIHLTEITKIKEIQNIYIN